MCARHASVTEHAVKKYSRLPGGEREGYPVTGSIFTALPLTPAVVRNTRTGSGYRADRADHGDRGESTEATNADNMMNVRGNFWRKHIYVL